MIIIFMKPQHIPDHDHKAKQVRCSFSLGPFTGQWREKPFNEPFTAGGKILIFEKVLFQEGLGMQAYNMTTGPLV